MQALEFYDNNEFEEALNVFDAISDTSKILFNCGVIHATIGEHAQAVCLLSRFVYVYPFCSGMCTKVGSLS